MADRFLRTIVVAIVTVWAAAPIPLFVSPVCCQGNVSSSLEHLDCPLFQLCLAFS